MRRFDLRSTAKRGKEKHQETLALLKILALGNRQVEQGRVQPADRVLQRLRRSQTER